MNQPTSTVFSREYIETIVQQITELEQTNTALLDLNKRLQAQLLNSDFQILDLQNVRDHLRTKNERLRGYIQSLLALERDNYDVCKCQRCCLLREVRNALEGL